MMKFSELQKEIHLNAKNKGFWETDRNIPECLCLIHSEVSEALEDYRDNNMVTSLRKTDGKPEGFPTELADVVIRVMDLAESMGIDLANEIIAKHEYNKTRPYRHGKRA